MEYALSVLARVKHCTKQSMTATAFTLVEDVEEGDRMSPLEGY